MLPDEAYQRRIVKNRLSLTGRRFAARAHGIPGACIDCVPMPSPARFASREVGDPTLLCRPGRSDRPLPECPCRRMARDSRAILVLAGTGAQQTRGPSWARQAAGARSTRNGLVVRAGHAESRKPDMNQRIPRVRRVMRCSSREKANRWGASLRRVKTPCWLSTYGSKIMDPA